MLLYIDICKDTIIIILFPSHVHPRKDCREVEIKGAFPGADVVRGVDWNHEDKDGKQFRV